VGDFFKKHTNCGSEGHEDCAYNLRLCKDRDEANKHLINRAMTNYHVNQVGIKLLLNGIPIWIMGDRECDVGDFTTKILEWKQFKKLVNIKPNPSHHTMGALDEYDLEKLLEYY